MVATLMSFSRAAEALHCTQSTISAQIKALEEDLGAPVFERLGRRVALTSAGDVLLRRCRKLMECEQEIYAAVRGQQQIRGMLSLRVPQTVAMAYLPSILTGFHAAYPAVGFDVSNCGYHMLADELRSGATDAAFLLAEDIAAPELQSTLLRNEPMVFVTNPGSDLAKRTSLSIQDLEGRTLLLPKHDCGYRMELERSLHDARVRLMTLIELNCISSMIRCLRHGLGVALLPRVVVKKELRAKRLVALDWKEPMKSGLLLLRHRDRRVEGIFGAFIEAVELYFASAKHVERRSVPEE